MATHQTNVAQVTVLCTEDSTSNVLVNRSFAPSLDAASGVYGTYTNNPAAGPIVLPFPYGIVTIFNFYARNLAAPGGGNVQFELTWTTNGAPETVVLTPGDVILYWSNQNSVATAGIGISLIRLDNVPASTATFEYFLGG
jgi:hypothetical protein